jgi:hypothetical protein
MVGLVKRRMTIRHVLAALAWLGLVLGSLAGSVTAAPMELAAQVAPASTDMPEGMPCCPDKPAKPDCMKDCPFMAVCAGMAFPLLGAGAAPFPPIGVFAVIGPHDDAKLRGLAQGPPARPPKA